MSRKLSIIIVSYNTRDMLDRCLSSVFVEDVSLDLEIFVVDNASADDSSRMVKRKFPTVNVIENSKNVGFAAACNQALRVTEGEYILLLNPDVIIFENTLAKMLNYLEKYRQVGVVGCRILKENGKTERSAFPKPSLFNEISDILSRFRIEKIFPATFTRRKYDRFASSSTEPFGVYWVCGACLMIRRKTIDDIGLLDEKFFLFSEDVDWCCRAKKEGWDVIYYPTTKVIHYVGLSAKNNTDALRNRIYFSYERRFYFARKYFNKSAQSILKPIMFLDILFSILITNMRRDIPPIRKKMMLKAYREVLRLIFNRDSR